MSLLGEKLAYCRKQLPISKKELAELLSVSPSTLSRYEKGISQPSAFNLYLYSFLTDMPMEAFMSEIFSLEAFEKLHQKEFYDRHIEIYYNSLDGIF